MATVMFVEMSDNPRFCTRRNSEIRSIRKLKLVYLHESIIAPPLFRLPCAVLCTSHVSLAVTWKCYHILYNVYTSIVFQHELLLSCV